MHQVNTCGKDTINIVTFWEAVISDMKSMFDIFTPEFISETSTNL